MDSQRHGQGGEVPPHQLEAPRLQAITALQLTAYSFNDIARDPSLKLSWQVFIPLDPSYGITLKSPKVSPRSELEALKQLENLAVLSASLLQGLHTRSTATNRLLASLCHRSTVAVYNWRHAKVILNQPLLRRSMSTTALLSRKRKRGHPYLSGNFAPIHSTVPLTACQYSGSIPDEICGGEYVRNGGE